MQLKKWVRIEKDFHPDDTAARAPSKRQLHHSREMLAPGGRLLFALVFTPDAQAPKLGAS